MTNGKTVGADGLSPNQKAAISRAPQAEKQKLRTMYRQQNSNNKKKPTTTAIVPYKGPVAAKPKAGPKPVAQFKGHGFSLNPLDMRGFPSAISDGMALYHCGLISHDFTVGPGETVFVYATNTGCSGTVCNVAIYTDLGKPTQAEVSQTILTIPTLKDDAALGGATSGKANKCGLSIVNVSNGYRRGGRVTTLNTSQRLPTYDQNTGFLPTIEAIKASPYRRRITGEMLAKPSQLIAYPVDNTAYNSFQPWEGSLTHPEFNEYVLVSAPVPGVWWKHHSRPMSTLCYVFDPSDQVQDYSLTVRASFDTRWPLTSVPGQSMRPIPTAPAAHINHVRDTAEANSQALTLVTPASVATGAAAGAAAGGTMGALGQLARFAMRSGTLGRTVEGAELAGAYAAAAPAEAEGATLLMV